MPTASNRWCSLLPHAALYRADGLPRYSAWGCIFSSSHFIAARACSVCCIHRRRRQTIVHSAPSGSLLDPANCHRLAKGMWRLAQVAAIGKQRLVLDLSCRKRDGIYYVVTDRWQRFSELAVDAASLQVPAPAVKRTANVCCPFANRNRVEKHAAKAKACNDQTQL